MSALNIEKKDIDIMETVVHENEINYYIALVVKKTECLFCGAKMYSNGTKLKVNQTSYTS